MDTLPASIRARLTGFAIDSREVAPGNIFGAFPGEKVNGEAFIPGAIAKGAIAVVAHPEAAVTGALHIKSATPRAAFAKLAAPYYAPYPEVAVAVTGTNGKTSTVELTRQLWALSGEKAASMGTLGSIIEGKVLPGTSGMTTPDILTFLKEAADLARRGISHLAFEASSHGLAQCRTEGLPVLAAAFTNLTRDHLDYHKTMEAYFAAKLRLFTDVLSPTGTAIVWYDKEADGAAFNARVLAAAKARQLRTLSVGPDGRFIRLLGTTPEETGQQLHLEIEGHAATIHLPLIGGYQAANALMAAAFVMVTGSKAADVLALFPRLTGVRGRLELAATTATGAPLYVDYAHTPAGIEAALAALRPHTRGRLFIVFGCGGDRDHGKRPQMGAIATRDADVVIVTDDNPRSEDPASIRQAILAAAPGAREIGGRRDAIAAAITEAQAGDSILLAGKGHEEGQIVGTTVIPFNDATVARELVKELS